MIQARVNLGMSKPSVDSSCIVLLTISDLIEFHLNAFSVACESTKIIMYSAVPIKGQPKAFITFICVGFFLFFFY